MPIGTRVRLASGGPIMLVVDLDPQEFRVLVAWDDAEVWLPVVCLDVVRNIHVLDDE